MKLALLREAPADTRTVLEILTAAVASMEIRGSYVPKSKDPVNNTAFDASGTLWPTMADAIHTQIKAKMRDPDVVKKAQEILDWFNGLDPAVISRNDFMTTAKSVIDKKDLTSRQAGFAVGIIPGFIRDKGFSSAAGGQDLIRQWPDEWGEFKMIYKQNAQFSYARIVSGPRGTAWLTTMILEPDNIVFTWIPPSGIQLKAGDVITMTGYLRPDSAKRIQFWPERRFKNQFAKTYNPAGENEDGEDVHA